MAQVLLIAIDLLYITVHHHDCVTSMSQDIQIGLLYTYNMYTILTYRTHSPYWEVIMNTKLAPPIPLVSGDNNSDYIYKHQRCQQC